MGEISNFTFSQQVMQHYMTSLLLSLIKFFLIVDGDILKWFIHNNVQLISKRVSQSPLKSDIFNNYELIKIKITYELSQL